MIIICLHFYSQFNFKIIIALKRCFQLEELFNYVCLINYVSMVNCMGMTLAIQVCFCYLQRRSSLGLESGELSLNMTGGPEASVLHAHLSQAKE